MSLFLYRDFLPVLEGKVHLVVVDRDTVEQPALFPEMWSCGYTIPENPNELLALSISQDSDFVQRFGQQALELDMAIGITYLERYEIATRNTLTLFDRHGNAVFTYAKVRPAILEIKLG